MNIVEQVQRKLKTEIAEAVLKAGLASKEELPEVVLELPKNKEYGDYATNMAMQLARIAKKAPRQIAEELVASFDRSKASIEKIEIAGPGFINFYLDNHYLTELIPAIIQSGEEYGETNEGKGKKIQIEFVSANPTGSLHLGHARGAAVGDTLCNLLDKAGFDVSREYYINDAGNQIHNLALSIEARYFEQLGKEVQMPEDGYYGKDIIGFAKEIVDQDGDKYVELNQEERLRFFREFGLKKELEKIQKDLADFRVDFDEWYSETSLYTSGKIDQALELLNSKGVTYEKDGATWFKTTDFGDDKDRVLIKNDGTYTYLTPDIAYHFDKLQRGFETVINIWGADHHGYIPRMKAAFEALGYNREQLEIQIIQLVSLFQNGEKVKMSKRTGKAVTLRELMEEVGIDAMRYFFAMRSSDSHLDFDMDLAVSHSNENPVYYVQYAHARVCSMLRQGADKGYTYDGQVDLSPIQSEKEYDLLKKLGEFPVAVTEAALTLSTHRMTNYLFELASTLHSFYNAERVLDDENPDQSNARYALMKAVQQTLQNGLKLIGVSAPKKM
ncbi:arginine--tRNA ligase [Alkalihalobacillus sp. AL-G]|uniref:arginine--tRNA ligase n=1 Tax=Alkalihalobacillus sp. AL-G TaxID=2926399 RepID=UPI002729DE89|nr:arginine--tRNA ligase [Alkalihalobacillus sp. AL-G]WLD93206.1 arginine--tRNA ligase [Alkalihalobacillus sp. AL-G]